MNYANYPKYMHPADQICLVMKRLYDQNLTTLTGGNLSIMDAEGVMWVSPSGVDKSSLTREDIVQVLPNWQVVGNHKPTSEYRIHKSIYAGRPEMKAVVHAHPPALVAMSATHLMPDSLLTIDANRAFGNVGMAEYAMAGTEKLSEYVGAVFRAGHDLAVLKNHAAFLGSTVDLFDGFCRFEQFDFTARMQMNAWAMGKVTPADPATLAQYEKAFSAPAAEQEKGTAGHGDEPACTPRELEMRRTLTALTKRAYGKRLFTGLCGVISGRVNDGTFVITPAKRDNAYLTEEDFVRVENGAPQGGKSPDGLYKLHDAIYKKHPKVQSIISAAPLTAGAYAVCGEPFDVTIIPESYGVLRDSVRIGLGEFIEQPERVAACYDHDFPVCVVENLGILAAGPTPVLTFDKLEVAESTAQSLQMARLAGTTIIPMTREQQIEADLLG